MIRVLVTGATGVLGHALVEELKVASAYEIAAITHADGDLRHLETTCKIVGEFKPEIVVHLAARVYGLGGNRSFPFQAINDNFLINASVLEACRRHRVRKVVGMGSTAIYSDSARRPFCEADAFIGVPHGSEIYYAAAKRALYQQLEALGHQTGIEFAYTISTNLYGPCDRYDPKFGHMIPSLVGKFIEAEHSDEKTVTIWGDGSPKRDILYAADAARAIVLIMENGQGAFNLAVGESVTVRDVVDVIAALFPTVNVVWDTTRPMGQTVRDYDVTRLKTLGFVPQVTLTDGIRTTVDWFKKNWTVVRRSDSSEIEDHRGRLSP